MSSMSMIDTKERIARSNIYSIFGKLLSRLIDSYFSRGGEIRHDNRGLL